MSHENVVVQSDRKTVYFGEDAPDGSVYKFVADVADNLTSGTLYVLKINQPLVGGEPQGTTGQWVVVPNTTKQERNTTKAQAIALAATPFAGVEDVEISPLDGKIYFAVKGVGRVYRFTDDGTTVSNFATFAGNRDYRITTQSGVVSEPWGQGNDNLSFDDRGNLWVLQDGGRNHVWLLRPDHTQDAPKVEVFMQTPAGSEPTGMTFTPDYRYMFISIQEPSSANTDLQEDVAGVANPFNKSRALVVARSKYLGVPQNVAIDPNSGAGSISVYPNPFRDVLNIEIETKKSGSVGIELVDQQGRIVMSQTMSVKASGKHSFELPVPADLAMGLYFCRVSSSDAISVQKLLRQ
ncbi:MAG: DUF839 domain-containing protein [Bacteroidetes bacterium]|nr:MAG: DUF839 domain-containing protein [Bacteroidota bacterium]